MNLPNHWLWRIFIFVWTLTTSFNFVYSQPITKDSHNARYLNYQGHPILLVTSAEHYGAVLNADFDYKLYLRTLHQEGMNYTRIFTGSYVEVPGSFGIEFNSLSPKEGAYLAPWQRVKEAGLYAGEGKFDFEKWNDQYFERLHDFIRTADQYGIIVEVTFFCATYQDQYWVRHPFNSGNNINNLGTTNRKDFNTLKNRNVVKYQNLLVEKITQELNQYDNIFFEICNEPWADNGIEVTFLHKTIIPRDKALGWMVWSSSATPEALDWQKVMANTFKETEAYLPKKHLLAQNYSNFKEILTEVDDHIDILNFHYAWPEAVIQNYGWNRPISFDESGFAGREDTTYLQQAWAFMLSGGAIFNNLDYSFYQGSEDGTGLNNAPGGGSRNFRMQLKFLHDFMKSVEFIKLKPSNQLITHSPGLDSYCLAEIGRSYLIYLQGRNQGAVVINLPAGQYDLKIYDPDQGKLLLEKKLNHQGDDLELTIPKLSRLALRLTDN